MKYRHDRAISRTDWCARSVRRPCISWLSRRATQEGRLALKLERYGALYLSLPDSPEKVEFEKQVTRITRQLNEWLEADNVARRQTNRILSTAIYVFGFAGSIFAVPFALATFGASGSFIVGLLEGALIAFIRWIAIYFVERRERLRLSALADAAQVNREDARAEALRHGEPMPR